MNSITLSSLLQEAYSLFGCPVSLYDKEECLFSCTPFLAESSWSTKIRKQLRKDTPPAMHTTVDLLQYALVKDEESGYEIILGPVSFDKPSANRIRSILLHADTTPNSENIAQCSAYFASLHTYSMDHFLKVVHFIDGMLNRRSLSVHDISDRLHLSPNEKEMTMIEQEQFDEGKITVLAQDDYEETMLYYVEHGMVKELQTMGSYTGVVPELGPDSVRHYKNAMVILNTLCLRAAVKGGADSKTVYQLGQVYMHKIESCSSLNQLLAIHAASPIAVTYARMVQDTAVNSQKNPKVRQAMTYIRENYQKRLTVGEIAEVIGTSKEYLSSLFHKETGTTIPAYINDLKIRQAKALLLYTDYTFGQISEILSFSSQSYFQTQFKKTAGVTPAVYRRQGKAD